MARSSPPGSPPGDDVLPPGLTFDPGGGPQAAPDVATTMPQDDSVLPPGLTFTPPPQVALEQKQAAPPPPPPESDPKPEEAAPGKLQIMTSAYNRGLAERATFDATAGRIALPQGVGGLTLEQGTAQAPPETKDYINKLIGQNIVQGATNPDWWMAQIAHTAGGSTPGLGAMAAGAAVGSAVPGVGTALGAAAGIGGEAFMGTFVPAYQAAVADKSAHPVARALFDSGIDAAYAIALGAMGKVAPASALGRRIGGEVGKVLERPAADALASLGIVGPGLAVAQDMTIAASHGQMPDWGQAATDAVTGGIFGVGVHFAWKGLERTGIAREPAEPGKPATEGEIEAVAAAQAPHPFGHKVAGRFGEPGLPAAVPTPDAPEVPDYPSDGEFYKKDFDQLRPSGEPGFGDAQIDTDIYHAKIGLAVQAMPDKMPASEVVPFLKKMGIPEDELRDGFIPSYLRDATVGNVRRQDLQDWVDANRIQVWQRVAQDAAGGAIPGREEAQFKYGASPAPYARADLNYLKDRDGHSVMQVSDLEQLAAAKDTPKADNWQDITAKRLMQLAADRGATRLVDDTGDPRFGKAIERWGKMYGSEMGETKPLDEVRAKEPGTPPTAPQRFVRIQPDMAEHVHRDGQGLHDSDVEVRPAARKQPGKGKTLSDFVQTNPMPEHLRPDMRKLGDMFNEMASKFKVSRGIDFVREENPRAKYRGFLKDDFVDPITGNYVIHVNLSRLMTRNDLYASMSHEFGHVLEVDKFKNEKPEVQAPIYAAHDAWRAAQSPADRLVGDARRTRDNAISQMTKGRAMHDDYLISDLVPRSKNYFLSFQEWFAEQAAKYMQTSEKPLGVVDQFFHRLGNVVRQAIVKFRQMRDGKYADPERAVKDYLDQLFDAPTRNWIEPIKRQFDQDTRIKAQKAYDREGTPEMTAVPMEGSGAGGRSIIKSLGSEFTGKGDAMAADGDRMNAFYRIFTGLPQIQRLNQHIRQLANYLGMHRAADVELKTIMGQAKDRLDQWSRVMDKRQLFNITNLMQEYAHMDLRPNADQFRDLVKKHDVSGQGVKLFQDVTGDFDNFLERYRKLLVNDALNIKDARQRALNLTNINTQFDSMLKKPFMPIAHFGKYMVTVYDKDQNMVHQQHVNSVRLQRKLVEELKASKDRFPTDQVLPSEVPKDAMPFLGMPPGMLDLIGDKLQLSPTQRAALDQLKFDYAPANSFKRQFRNLDLLPGYSTDFPRAYASFFFHGAHHITRLTWADAMRDQINSLNSVEEHLARIGNRDGANKLDQIVKYMQGHFEAWSNPKNDWAALRGLMFHVYLGMSPASAVVNLIQTPLSTYPWLASKYGDLQTMKALAKASTDLNNFYKKGTLLTAEEAAKGQTTMAAAKARAMAQLAREGTISESQAHQLAAVAEDRNLMRPFGTKAEKAWLKFQEASGWMFDASEQYNRRVASAAAWELAWNAGENHKAVQAAILQDPIVFQKLINSEAQGGLGWSRKEAAAMVAAKNAVETTQFEYQPFAKPEIFRRLGGAVFVFKQFTQNMLFNLATNPGMLGRWLVIMGALGGLGGMPGWDNINSVVKTIAGRLFGKDFDLDDEVRHFATDVLGGAINPDILLHGMSVKGFGIPHVLHSMGVDFPTIDMSRSVGMGDVLGFDPMKLTGLAMTKQPREEELRQIGRASGAAFGMIPSLFDFASADSNFTDIKKYEPLMPHWLGALSHAFRWYSQGKETNASGNAIIKFNPADTENMMEILARAGGFQPRRLTEEWERTGALKESSDFWDIRREGLLRQYGDAVKNGDEDGISRTAQAIGNYNDQLPPEAGMKAITGKAMKSSVRQRLGVAAKTEAGIPTEKSDIPLLESMEPYYPRGWGPDQIAAKPVN